VGGAETLLRSLATCLADAGARVTFLTTCARNHFTWENELPAGTRSVGNFEVHYFPVDEDRDLAAFLGAQNTISRGREVDDDTAMTWLRNNVNSRALCDHLREHEADYDRIVMGPYLFGLIYEAARVAPGKTLLVPCLHDEPFAYLGPFREMFRSVRGVLFNAEPERDLACRVFGLEAERGSVVGMGLDDFDSRSEGSPARARVDGAPYLLFCGRREPLKGTPLLMDYVKTFRERSARELKLVFTGTGELEIPSGLGPHVVDLGFVSEQEKHDAMAGALAFCHPSTLESFGIVCLESWLARTPCLVHAGSAVLKHQCRMSNGGLWFRCYAEFEEAVTLLLDRPDIAEAMGAAGRAYVLDTYSWDAVRPRLIDAIRR
jgi:glycosyltransferase involved in cell wall biosynthesis